MQTIDGSEYVYLLGLYLGDGCISRSVRSATLVITLDSRLPEIVAACSQAMQRCCPNPVTAKKDPRYQCVRVRGAWKLWPVLFPQHGRGRKHARPMKLEDWQWDLVGHHRAQFVRGLIHSDGCRTINRFTTRLPSGRIAEYEYVRYFFSNRSADIRAMFCRVCEELGIRWTQSNARNISISHRDSVAIMERLVGPKH